MRGLGMSDPTLPAKTPILRAGQLKEMIGQPQHDIALVKMVFPRKTHLDAMHDLKRMNITAASLFPGVDGFAKSLQFSLRMLDGLEVTE